MGAREVVIVGAGLAGTRCAETLRALGFDGRVTVVGAEVHAPYERPALSKELLSGAREPASLALRSHRHWGEHGIELRLGLRVTRVDRAARTARLSDGTDLTWDALVLATGATARGLSGGPVPHGTHRLRTIDDALGLRDELRPGRRLVIVGAGFVGAEVASTAVELGVDVTLVDAAPPFERLLGPEVSELLVARHRRRGVELELGTGVDRLEERPDGRLRAVVLADGRRLVCDAVLVGIGASASTELAPDLAAPDGGIVTDAEGCTEVPDVYACGDVASAWRPWLGAHLRVEHWTGAASQAVAVARHIADEPYVHEELPYFWSDQAGVRLQYVGHAPTWDRLELEGGGGTFVARYLGRDGALLAALAVDRPGEVPALRRELAAAPAAAAA